MVVCMPVPLTRLSWDPTPRETPMRPLTLFAVLLATLAACRDAARRESREYSSGQAVADRVGAARAVPAARPEAAPALMRARERAVATRTAKLKDVLDVQQGLARVREEIDRYEGRLRYLRAHAALSTFTIYVHEPLPIVGRAGSSVMGEALAQAWRNFVDLVALCVR